MFSWIAKLFGSLDRQTAAADRAAVALEDIAESLEGMRDQIRARLGGAAEVPKLEESNGRRKALSR